ncbi:hypothetical protein BLNAU_24455 [Blattamonas nauphoetae]|uniref:Uncharacterized protein n=1 Tax=Blattamonas nauphoetae TaxID=2049346 RepID=A0ABQ9WMQ0_9EUKA|nr:hypothetical protein BLNAU_24455 [Blattamonas nauphoetae]
MNYPTIESVMEWLSDSSVHPRNKVNSFQWFHIPSLLTTHIQSQQEQPTKQNNEVLSQLLQRMMTILDECFDCHTPIANKRLLHSSLSQLSQSPSLEPKIKRGAVHCLGSLEILDEGRFAIVETSQLDLMESNVRTIADLKEQLTKQQQLNQYEHLLAMRAKKEGERHGSSVSGEVHCIWWWSNMSGGGPVYTLNPSSQTHFKTTRHNEPMPGELAELLVEEQSVHWQMWALQIEKVQILKERQWQRRELMSEKQKLKEKKREIEELKQIVQQMETEMARRREFVRVKYRRRSDFRYAQI